MSFEEVIARHFPGSSAQSSFVRKAAATLIQRHGFTPANSLACVGVCRDELCKPLSEEVEQMWGRAFDFSSLAGILTLGTTGMAAARAHAPIVGGRSRYLFFLFSHIGIGTGGELGVAQRPGHEQPTAACGALVKLLADWQGRRRGGTIDWRDPEQSLLEMRMRKMPDLGDEPDLLQLTKAAHRATVEDVVSLVSSAFDRQREDLAVVAGIQIHEPQGGTLIWPGATWMVVGGVRSEIWI